jgi:hypothetical protein
MDNARAPWELPAHMRTAPSPLLVVAALWALAAALARPAAASESEARRGVEAANAALSAVPPARAAARDALARATQAADDAESTAEAYFLLGKLDEEDDAFARAIADDRAAVAAAPNTRWAQRASDRIDWLRARSEGDFLPLARLEGVRRVPVVSSDPAAIEALARDAEAFPPGTVRVEARMLVAEAWLGRMHRPDAAVAELRAVREDPFADPLTVRLAERELVGALVVGGRIDDAAAEARSHAARLDPSFVRQVERLLVRRAVRYGAFAILAAFLGLAAIALARAGARGRLAEAWRELRRLAPVSALFVAFVAGAGGILASNYESGNAAPFLMLGATVFPLVMLARAWGAVGSTTRAARVGRAILCSATVVAAAFVLLDATHPQYLAGFGL